MNTLPPLPSGFPSTTRPDFGQGTPALGTNGAASESAHWFTNEPRAPGTLSARSDAGAPGDVEGWSQQLVGHLVAGVA